jgi:2-dehydro-3-deoxyphosphogluconate aldolase/(4S)-4-hydroxy-2-oxoglutarate aldolase
MTKQELFDRIQTIGIIPAVRVTSAEAALFASNALLTGGIPIVEITMTVPDAPGVIRQLRRDDTELIVGAGTILDLDTARKSLDAGAMFLTSTGLDLEVVEFARKNEIPMIPGALTPSEIMTAMRAGAEFIKIFPCSVMGGPSYISALKGPFPHLRLVASGGVNQQTASEYIKAGSSAIGVGQDLLPREAIRLKNIEWIHELTRRFLSMVREGREPH